MSVFDRSRILSALFLVVALTAHAPAATIYWAGDVDANWNTDPGANTNWSTTSGSNTNSTALPGTGDIAEFTMTGAANLDTTLGQAFTLQGLRFTSASPVTINTVHTNLLTLTNTVGIVVTQGDHSIIGSNTGSSAQYDLKIGNNAGFAFDIAASSSLTITARLTSNSNTNIYNKTGAGTLILKGHSGASGAWQFHITGGAFNVNEGVLAFTHSSAGGNSGNRYSVASGAALELRGVSYGQVNGNLTLRGSGIGGNGALRSTTGFNTIADGTASVVLATNSTIGVDAGTLAIAQDITNTGGNRNLTKVGAGTLILAHASNTYAGTTTVSGGELLVTGGLTASSAIVQVGAAIGGSGTITNNLTLNAGAKFVFDPLYVDATALTVSGTFGLDSTFGVDDLIAADGSAVVWGNVTDGIYKLLNTSTVFSSSNIEHFGLSNAYDLGGGRAAYFSNGSLNLNVVTIPEPSSVALLLLSVGLTGYQWRRRIC